MSYNINIIVLAAGMSSRMGDKNKLLLPFGSATILETTLRHLMKLPIDEIVVVLGHENERLGKKIKAKFPELFLVYNENFHTGQVSSVKAGISALHSKNPIMIALGDMPFLTSQDYELMINTFELHNQKKPSILRPIGLDGQVGNPVLFDFDFKDDLLNNEHLTSSKPVIMKHHASFVKWRTENIHFFKDIDSPEDYRKVLHQEKLNSSGS